MPKEITHSMRTSLPKSHTFVVYGEARGKDPDVQPGMAGSSTRKNISDKVADFLLRNRFCM
jgi:hypothetical protein